jgi:hypothetical protein
LKDLYSLAADNGILYAEIPYDSPFYKQKTDYLQYFFNKNFSLKSIFERFLLMLKSPHIMHEHINFFTKKSLEILLSKAGFKTIDTDDFICESKLGRSKNIGILAKKIKKSCFNYDKEISFLER